MLDSDSAYKVIACDLDDTLVDSNGLISEENIEYIKKAGERGVKFVPISGRGIEGIQFVTRALGVDDLEDEYTIACNGGMIFENKNNKVLSYRNLPYKIADEIYKRGLNYDVGIHIYTNNGVYVANISPAEREYLSNRLPIKEFENEDLSFLDPDAIVKIIFVNTDYDYLKFVEKELEDIVSDLEVSFSANRYMEFNNTGVDKGSGLKELLDILGVKPEEAIAIGDGVNDLPMIELAGLGVGVKNSYDEIKPKCDYITESDNDHSPIAEVIKKFIIKET